MSQKNDNPSGLTSVFCIADTQHGPHLGLDHIPLIAWELVQAQLMAARLQYRFVLVHIGDLGAFDSFSTHEKDHTRTARSLPTHKADIESVALFLKTLKDNVAKFGGDWQGLEKHITYGNHEDRIARWENENPRQFGIWSGALSCLLEEDFGFKISPYLVRLNIDGVRFVHCLANGVGKPKSNQNITWTYVSKAAYDLVMGHTHKAAVGHRPLAFNEGVRGFDIGSSMPYGHYEPYINMAEADWWWGTVGLMIYGGRVISWKYVSLKETEWKLSQLEL